MLTKLPALLLTLPTMGTYVLDGSATIGPYASTGHKPLIVFRRLRRHEELSLGRTPGDLLRTFTGSGKLNDTTKEALAIG